MKSILSLNSKIFPKYLWLTGLVLSVTLAMISRSTIPVSAEAKSTQSMATVASVPMLAATVQPVNNSYGNQTNPRVNCNTVSYTNDDFQGTSSIHYFDLPTGTDNTAPGNGLDRLSDVFGSRLAYTEITAPDGDQIVMYDTISQTRTVVPGYSQDFARMGGNILAFREYNSLFTPADDEIAVYDLNTGVVTRLTNDALPDQFPAVSPSGNVIVWQKCQPDGTACDIYSAIQSSPGVYTIRQLTDATGNEQLPQTNGQTVVYTSDKSGENDIYYQPVGGGAETHISIPGDQREPTISGNLISFESNQTGNYEIFVYDLSSGILYQVTNTGTSGSDKTLNHISVCNGTGHIVYAVPGFGDFDVYALTFTPPTSLNIQIDSLVALVRSFHFPDGIETSLVAKLQDAITALNAGDTAAACIALNDFINQVNAQSGKKLTTEQAQQLVQSATAISSGLGCG